jgi:hypothetical protein
VLAATLSSGCHVVLEGQPGTGKSTLLRAVADGAGLGVEFVEGNAELTPARLVGHHDPALVLEAGYTPETFVDGPLISALREGRLLYIEELNRVPEETLNVLVGALAEGEIHVPRLGRVSARELFVRAGRLGGGTGRGYRRLSPGRAGGEGDLDLDLTLEVAGGRPKCGDELVARRWTAPRRALCLLAHRPGTRAAHGVTRTRARAGPTTIPTRSMPASASHPMRAGGTFRPPVSETSKPV